MTSPVYNVIKVKDYSPAPRGRYRSDGPYNAETFRDDILLPALNKGSVCIDLTLDGIEGYPSNWLEEVFGNIPPNVFNTQQLIVRGNKEYQEYARRALKYSGVCTKERTIVDKIKSFIFG